MLARVPKVTPSKNPRSANELCSELDSAETQNARPEKLRSGWGCWGREQLAPFPSAMGSGERCKLPGKIWILEYFGSSEITSELSLPDV